MGIGESSPTQTEIYEVLHNERRRHAIEALRERFGSATLSELTDDVANEEAGTGTPTQRLRKSVYNSLRQTHLPRLEEAGVIRYDREHQRAALRSDADHIDRYTDISAGFGMTWAELYRTLALVGFLTVLGTQSNLPIVGSLDVLLVAIVFLAALSVATASQLWTRRWRYLRWVYDDRTYRGDRT